MIEGGPTVTYDDTGDPYMVEDDSWSQRRQRDHVDEVWHGSTWSDSKAP